LGWEGGYLDSVTQEEKRNEIHHYIEEYLSKFAQSQLTTPSKKSSSSRKSKPAKKLSKNAYQKKFDKLKTYIKLCNDKKRFRKEEFAELSPSDILRKLKMTLKDLGIEGQPSKTKCMEIRKEREKREELEELKLNIVLPTRTRTYQQENPNETSPLEDKWNLSKYGNPYNEE
jgi:hypothetical protein